jgi:hypothetical protein
VEGENGRFRRQWLTPVPFFESWDAANEYLLARCIKDLDRRLPGRKATVGGAVAAEARALRSLPGEGFELAETSPNQSSARVASRPRDPTGRRHNGGEHQQS